MSLRAPVARNGESHSFEGLASAFPAMPQTSALHYSAKSKSIWGSPVREPGSGRSSPSHAARIWSAVPMAGSGGMPEGSHEERLRMARAYGLCCPLTQGLMLDPVVLQGDGYTYSRQGALSPPDHSSAM